MNTIYTSNVLHVKYEFPPEAGRMGPVVAQREAQRLGAVAVHLTSDINGDLHIAAFFPTATAGFEFVQYLHENFVKPLQSKTPSPL